MVKPFLIKKISRRGKPERRRRMLIGASTTPVERNFRRRKRGKSRANLSRKSFKEEERRRGTILRSRPERK